jgi:hypothetical protein
MFSLRRAGVKLLNLAKKTYAKYREQLALSPAHGWCRDRLPARARLGGPTVEDPGGGDAAATEKAVEPFGNDFRETLVDFRVAVSPVTAGNDQDFAVYPIRIRRGEEDCGCGNVFWLTDAAERRLRFDLLLKVALDDSCTTRSFGFNHSGTDGVDTDVARSQLLRERFRDRIHRRSRPSEQRRRNTRRRKILRGSANHLCKLAPT